MEYTYFAKRVIQWENAPPFYVIDVPSLELLEWASVPRKSDLIMEGFQRPLKESRATSITDFMTRDVNHIIPGTIIVTTDVVPDEGESPRISITPVTIEGEEDHNIFKITINYQEEGLEQMFEQHITDISNRMGEEERACSQLDYERGTDQANESWMSDFVRKMRGILADWDQLEYDEKTPWKSYISENHKLAAIMDGQHRVEGAANMDPDDCEHLGEGESSIVSVTLIPNLPVSEQVFHFAVMNMTPEKILDEQAKHNTTASLTKREFEENEARLEGLVSTNDALWMDDLERRDISPFRDRIHYQFNAEGERKFIRAGILNQIQSNWKKDRPLSHPIFNMDNARLWREDESKTSFEGFRFEMFCEFWREVSERFPEAWEDRESNLWKKVALWTLQDWCIKEMADSLNRILMLEGEAPFSSVEALKKEMKVTLMNIPVDFYDLAWRHVDDTPTGREDLRNQMEAQKGKPRVNRAHGNLFRRLEG